MIRERIVSRTLEMFQCHGVKRVTMDDIAHEFGISKRTLYEYFVNKDTLVMECVILRTHQGDLFNCRDLDLLDLLLDYFHRIEQLHVGINSLCVSDIRKYHGRIYAYMSSQIEVYAATFRKKVNAGIAGGYIRKGIEPDFVYTYLLWHLSKLFHENDSSAKSVDFLSQSVLVFSRGIATAKGQTHIDHELEKSV